MTNPTHEEGCTCASFFTVRGVHKEDCPCYKQVEGLTLEERLIRVWSSAEIPDYAADAKHVILGLISLARLEGSAQREKEMIEAIREVNPMTADIDEGEEYDGYNKTKAAILSAISKKADALIEQEMV